MPRVTGSRNSIKQLASSIQRNMDSMYRMTYYAEPTGNKQIDILSDRINNSIGNIIKHNINSTGTPNISKLYSRIAEKDSNLKNGKNGDMSDIFDSTRGFDDFYNNFIQNKYMVEMDQEIDAVCRYFPDIQEALDIRKEGVLAADHFSKDFMTVATPEGVNEVTFSERIKQIKKAYKLPELVDDLYDQAAKYGEAFVYIVPYKTAISKLLTDKRDWDNSPMNNIHPDGPLIGEGATYSLTLNESGCLIRSSTGVVSNTKKSYTYISESADSGKVESKPLFNDKEGIGIAIELSKSGMIESAIIDAYNAEQIKKRKIKSMSESFNEQFIAEKSDLVIVKKDKDTGKLKIDGMEDVMDSISSERLISDADKKKDKKDDERIEVDIPGCVIIKPKRYNVIPLYMNSNDTCLGYLYMEFNTIEGEASMFQGFTNLMADGLQSLRGGQSNNAFGNLATEGNRKEEILKTISAELSKFIDKEFVQANQDLRDDIYNILKYNDLFNRPGLDKIRVTFVPPEDMIHIGFNFDKDTHRGISDLDKAMIPAKIYSCMYITDAIGHMVRGQDKRVFYVKQMVDTNIAQVLMNTIQQLKQGNFGIRQFKSIDNVLNITGTFNDYLVPTSPSGESPIQIETIPGQQFTDNQEQMQHIKEMAISAIDVPFEYIQTHQSVDYAMQLSMSSSRFMRKIFKRQSEYQPFISIIMSKVYSYEYNCHMDLDVQLPPPMFITMANTNQLVTNTKEYIQAITEYEMQDEQDENLKATYMTMLFDYYIGTQIDLSKHELILKKAKAAVAVNKTAEE